MASFNKFNSFVEAIAEEKHNLGSDTLTIALTAAANAPVAGNSVLADLTQASYTYCSSRALTVSASSQTSGTYKLVVNDATLTASGGPVGPFQYIVIYNDTAPSDELIGWYDYGSDITLADGESLTVNFDGSNGVLQIA
jgi:hypothetical protein